MEKVLRLLIDLKETIFDRIDLKDLNFIFSTVPQPYSVLFNQPHKTLVETKSTSNHHHWSQPSSEPSSQPSAQPSSQPSSQPSHRITCLIIVTNPYSHECSSEEAKAKSQRVPPNAISESFNRTKATTHQANKRFSSEEAGQLQCHTACGIQREEKMPKS